MDNSRRQSYQHELVACDKTIDYLEKMIDVMEKQIEQLESIENQEKQNDYRFIHELFHLCPKSELSPSHKQIKIYVQETFNYLIKRTSKVDGFNCQCSQWIDPDHYPNYQNCLDILEQCQQLFGIKCYQQIPISLTNFYHKYGELKNFIHSVAMTIGVDDQNQLSVINTLESIVNNARYDQMNVFKALARVQTMHEARRKIHSYDNFVPYYHQFIEELIDLLEVSKADQILPAIKTLQLLAQNKNRHQ